MNDVQAIDDAQDEGRIRFERNTAYDGQVLSILGEDGGRPTLTTARNAVDAGEAFRPIMPGHSGWSWTLLNTAQDSTTYAYAAISWAKDNPTDCLAAGYWIHYPSYPFDYTAIEAAGFIDGPEIDPMSPPQLPMQGQATDSGFAGAGVIVTCTAEAGGRLSPGLMALKSTLQPSPSRQTFPPTLGTAVSAARERSLSSAPICTISWVTK